MTLAIVACSFGAIPALAYNEGYTYNPYSSAYSYPNHTNHHHDYNAPTYSYQALTPYYNYTNQYSNSQNYSYPAQSYPQYQTQQPQYNTLPTGYTDYTTMYGYHPYQNPTSTSWVPAMKSSLNSGMNLTANSFVAGMNLSQGWISEQFEGQ